MGTSWDAEYPTRPFEPRKGGFWPLGLEEDDCTGAGAAWINWPDRRREKSVRANPGYMMGSTNQVSFFRPRFEWIDCI